MSRVLQGVRLPQVERTCGPSAPTENSKAWNELGNQIRLNGGQLARARRTFASPKIAPLRHKTSAWTLIACDSVKKPTVRPEIISSGIFFRYSFALIYATACSMMTDNDHFRLEEWAEFVRGQVRPEDRARMERHLQQGCSDCARTLQLWRGVIDAASREAAFEPPDNVLRCAKALFNAFPPDKTSGLNLRVARLSQFGRQALGGVRASAGPVGTHLLFREGTVLLDMRVQPVRASESVSLMGQVVDSAQLNVRFEDRQVSVVRASNALAQTSTNEFGEFHLEFEPDEDLLLIIELENQSYLVSHLPVPTK